MRAPLVPPPTRTALVPPPTRTALVLPPHAPIVQSIAVRASLLPGSAVRVPPTATPAVRVPPTATSAVRAPPTLTPAARVLPTQAVDAPPASAFVMASAMAPTVASIPVQSTGIWGAPGTTKQVLHDVLKGPRRIFFFGDEQNSVLHCHAIAVSHSHCVLPVLYP